MSGKKRVYVLNKGRHNYKDATRFGEIVFLSKGIMDKNDFGFTARLGEEMVEDSYPDDYIMVTGLCSHLSILTASFAAKHGCLNLLIHDPKRGTYREKNFDFQDNKEGEKV